MPKFVRALFFCVLAALISSPAAGQVVINEFLADNATGLQDEDKERSDWIEIYNAGATPVDLQGWALTDDPEIPDKWTFPATNINPNAYLVVFASGKNRTATGKNLHASFSLSSGGEYLALMTPGGQAASRFAPEYPQQNANVSYGLAGGSLTSLRYFTTPTPNALNPGGVSDLSEPPDFLPPPGPYANTINVEIVSTQPNAIIRYTTNGLEPTISSPAYTAPISVVNSTVFRAKSFVPGLAPSATVTRTYTMIDPALANFSSNLPLLILTTFAKSINESVPTPASVTLIGTNGTRAYLNSKPDFDGRGALKIRGSSSTQFPKKSFALELQDELLLDRKVSLLGLPKESDWVLYAPYTDKTLMRDFLAYELSNEIGTYAPRTRFVEVYVDSGGGKLTQFDYAGVYVLIEKIKRDDNRVKVSELLPTQVAQPEVSGGYIWKKDRLDPGDIGFSTPRAGAFGYVEPKEQEIVPAQKQFLASYLNQFETSLYNAAFTNKTYENFYNVDAAIDHHWMVEATRNIDGYRLSTYVHKDRGGRITMGPIWDYNLTLGNADYLDGWLTNGWYYTTQDDSNYPWYRRLFADKDFNQRYIDRWSVIRSQAFAATNILPRVMQVAGALSESAGRNFVKWPTLGRYVWPNAPGYQTRTNYRAEAAWLTNWINGRFNWIDRQFITPPLFGAMGGIVAPGTAVSITSTSAAVYVTLDGSDPRLRGGAISPGAIKYSSPIVIDKNTRLFARAYLTNGSRWSASTVATYVVDQPRIGISEIMYAPEGDSEGVFEFVELKNFGPSAVDLRGYRLSKGIEFAFTNELTLSPGGLVVVARNPARFAERYPDVSNVTGPFAGALDNGGDRIVLEGPMRELLVDLTYDNAWHPATDGHGFSLVPRSESGVNLDDKAGWRASGRIGGSPGRDDAPVDLPVVVISEVLTHTDSPEVDAVELHNPGALEASVGNWFLSDDPGFPKKFRIRAGATIPPGGYLTLTEADFNSDPANPQSFALSSDGDEVALYSADAAGNLTGASDGFEFGAAANGVTFGRFVTSDAKVYHPALAAPTLGSPNAAPLIGPVVINEIRYSAAPYEPEFIELKNISAGETRLFDPANPKNTWRVDGVDFSFPTNVTIPAGGMVLVVQNDPARFRASNNIPENVQIFGPFAGSLQDNGELIELRRPDAPRDGAVPMIVVDAVRYNDKAPWPPAQAGWSASIERIAANGFGGEPANWRNALIASPGTENGSAYAAWRNQHFSAAELNAPEISGDSADPDSDGRTNMEEFAAATDPKSAASVLELNWHATALGTLEFQANAGRSYTVGFRPSFAPGTAWVTLTNYPAFASPRTMQITNQRAGYYQLRVP